MRVDIVREFIAVRQIDRQGLLSTTERWRNGRRLRRFDINVEIQWTLV